MSHVSAPIQLTTLDYVWAHHIIPHYVRDSQPSPVLCWAALAPKNTHKWCWPISMSTQLTMTQETMSMYNKLRTAYLNVVHVIELNDIIIILPFVFFKHISIVHPDVLW